MVASRFVSLSLVAACCTGALIAAAHAQTRPRQRERARFWDFESVAYRSADGMVFPESKDLPKDCDIGLAFSGGGVRSATATTGELRGLDAAGLLERACYVSSVSGGTWATVPWTFSGEPDLLGRYPSPLELDYDNIHDTPNGRMVEEITGVSLRNDVIKEAGLQTWVRNANADDLEKIARKLLGQADRPGRTYTTLLARNLISRLVDGAADRDFGLNAAHDLEWSTQNSSLGLSRDRSVLHPRHGRPFLIANATILNTGADLPHPGPVPIEFTPLYTGTWQQVGGSFGGVYAWPSVYDAATAMKSPDPRYHDYIEITHDETHPRITLADVAASSGAAPLFFLAGGNDLPFDVKDFLRNNGANYFPAFSHLAMRHHEVLKPVVAWPHADGGARDNLGITALLARQVKKIIVFINTDDSAFGNNYDISSLFTPGSVSATSDKRDIVVFKNGAASYDRIMADFDEAQRTGRPLVSCGAFDVAENPGLNVRPYRTSVCWIFPDKVRSWVTLLQPRLQTLVAGQCTDCNHVGRFSNFPWFSTFFQNRDLGDFKDLGVLWLTTAQVNLLSDLMAWTVVESKETIVKAFR